MLHLPDLPSLLLPGHLPHLPPLPPPALPNITCNQYVKVSSPVSNTSAFGPYAPSKITYNVCYSYTFLTQQTGTSSTVNFYLSDLGGFPHKPAVNITQNITVSNITTFDQCTNYLSSVATAEVNRCRCLPGITCKCSAQFYCCVNANCNTPVWFTSGAGKVVVSSILLAVSLIAAISAGIF